MGTKLLRNDSEFGELYFISIKHQNVCVCVGSPARACRARTWAGCWLTAVAQHPEVFWGFPISEEVWGQMTLSPTF